MIVKLIRRSRELLKDYRDELSRGHNPGHYVDVLLHEYIDRNQPVRPPRLSTMKSRNAKAGTIVPFFGAGASVASSRPSGWSLADRRVAAGLVNQPI